MDNTIITSYQDIYSEIKETLLFSRNQAYNAVSFAMVRRTGKSVKKTGRNGGELQREIEEERRMIEECEN